MLAQQSVPGADVGLPTDDELDDDADAGIAAALDDRVEVPVTLLTLHSCTERPSLRHILASRTSRVCFSYCAAMALGVNAVFVMLSSSSTEGWHFPQR